jgi:hypothetical protein
VIHASDLPDPDPFGLPTNGALNPIAVVATLLTPDKPTNTL